MRWAAAAAVGSLALFAAVSVGQMAPFFGFRETLFAEGVSSRGAFGALRRDGRQLGEGLAVDLADPCAEVAVGLAVHD